MRNLSYAVMLAGVVGLVGAGSAAAQDPKWVTVKGQIVFAGNPPPGKQLEGNKDEGQRLSKGPLPNEEWVINPGNKGIKNVIVWLAPENASPGGAGKPPIHPSLAQPKEKTVTLDQPVCAFVPHCMAMREGQTLLVLNTAP